MAIVQVTKIQFRRGLESELTTSNNNSSGLDQGEPGFTTDSGRLFIGSNSASGAWSARVVPPYDNIEVLTEFATDTFARLFDRDHRTQGPLGISEANTNRNPYLIAQLQANTTTWTAVEINTFDVATGLYSGTEQMILAQADNSGQDPPALGANMNYFITSNSCVIRTGTLVVTHNGNTNVNVALLEDDNVSYASITGNSNACLSTTAYPESIQFQVELTSPSVGAYDFVLNYQNPSLTANATMYLTSAVVKPAMPS